MMIDFETLYSWVKDLPIIDWHNHLDMRMLAADKPLGSLYEVWVKSDPYKHRAMRICGEPERLITTGTTDVPSVGNGNGTGTTDVPSVGNCSGTGTTDVSSVGNGNGQDARCPSDTPPLECEAEKWAAWMRTLPKLVGNPIFAWARMELEWLGIDPEPYLHGSGENISLADWTPSKMLAKFGVEYMSPCVGAGELEALGQRTSRPLGIATSLGQRTSRPLGIATALGQRTSRPLGIATALGQRTSRPLGIATGKMPVVPVWTAPVVKIFPVAQTDSLECFSHTLQTGSYHRRNLPHIGQSRTLVFVTFRLADSLPQACLASMEAYRNKWLQLHPEPWDEATRQEWNIEIFDKIEKWLDAGYGACILANPRLRKIVENALEFFNAAGSTDATGTTDVSSVGNGNGAGTTDVPSVGNGNGTGTTDVSSVGDSNGQDARCPSKSARYRLHGYVVMPNHVHVLMEIFDGEDLSKIVQSWKSFTAKELNRQIGSSGAIWMPEYHDRLIRNAEHYRNVICYIRKNGVAARKLAEINGVRSVDATGTTDVPSVGNGNGTGTTDVSSVGGSNGTGTTDVPSVGDSNGQDARCPSIVPSLRMNAGDVVPEETLEKFHAAGCRVVDVSVDDVSQLIAFSSQDSTHNAQLPTTNYQLPTIAAYAAAHGWTMLLHLGALRETSARLRAAAGAAGGFAGMRAPVDPAAVAAFLNGLESAPKKNCTGTTDVPSVGGSNGTGTTGVSPVGGANGQDARSPSGLPRTVLMSLNPEAHAQLAVLAGSFNGEGMPGKVQLGPAWWWCDHEEGIRDVLEKNAAYGVLSTFIGMTTDSRSLLSFVRHDYFRRILCQWVAEKVAAGVFPSDETLLRPMLENVSYRNAERMIK